MNVSWKLIRTSIAMSACIGLLAACQDRGAFKSRTWTPEQIKANLAAKNAADARKNSTDSNDPAKAPVAPAPDTGSSGGDQSKGDPAKGGTVNAPTDHPG